MTDCPEVREERVKQKQVYGNARRVCLAGDKGKGCDKGRQESDKRGAEWQEGFPSQMRRMCPSLEAGKDMIGTTKNLNAMVHTDRSCLC